MNDSSSARIVAGLQRWIASASPGAQLPSTRALVEQYGVSPVTVQKALRALQATGAVESRPGVGTFVRAARLAHSTDFGWQTAALGTPQHRIPRFSSALRSVPNDVIALHSGYPDRELLPERLVRGAFGRAARSDAAIARALDAGAVQRTTGNGPFAAESSWFVGLNLSWTAVLTLPAVLLIAFGRPDASMEEVVAALEAHEQAHTRYAGDTGGEFRADTVRKIRCVEPVGGFPLRGHGAGEPDEPIFCRCGHSWIPGW